MPSTTVTNGSCICGETKYSFEGQPVYTARCHCLDCRKLSGGTHSTCFLIPRPQLSVQDDSALKTKTFNHHSGGFPITLSFCGSCGTSLFKEAPPFQGVAIVFTGTVDDGGELIKIPPQSELWTTLRVEWNQEVKGAKQCEGWDEEALG